MKLRFYFGFLFAELVASFFIFRSGISGSELFAPIDIAPALFSKYSYINPRSSGVPANHHVIDQLTYDLPIQLTIYEAYHHGEIPWWDPYNYAGRPLLADAHINGTDPIRYIAYVLLPFELAYNWTLIGHSLLTAVGMLLLLRYFGFSDCQCVLLAITYQFSTAFVLQFGHPWVQAAFSYYPALWLCWDKWLRLKAGKWLAAASILVAAIFYSGNLQSHSYLAIFALAFLCGYGATNKATWKTLLPGIILSVAAGFALAAPVLMSQLELFVIGSREFDTALNPAAFLGGVASLSAVFPWSLGTFRTLDLSKLADQGFHFGFAIFIGSAAFWLAVIGVRTRTDPASILLQVKRTACWLLALYVGIISTPLVKILYLRCSPLGALALTILAAIGLSSALESPERYRAEGRWLLVLAVSCALLTNVVAFVIYPKVLPHLKERVLRRANLHGVDAPALRRFQFDNFPIETSARNPETVLALSSLLLLAALLLNSRLGRQRRLWFVLLILNAVPVLLYSHRFIPRQPIADWDKLRNGGPEQQKALPILADTPFRLYEPTAVPNNQLFPRAMSHLYRIRTLHGYAALRPRTAKLLSSAVSTNMSQLADYAYLDGLGHGTQALVKLIRNAGLARFEWLVQSNRKFEVEHKGLNSIRLRIDPGDPGTLQWRDTPYPGWQGVLNGRHVELRSEGVFATFIEIDPGQAELTLTYRPRFLLLGISMTSVAVIILGVVIWFRASRSPAGPRSTPLLT